jgi:hypothetical protein
VSRATAVEIELGKEDRAVRQDRAVLPGWVSGEGRRAVRIVLACAACADNQQVAGQLRVRESTVEHVLQWPVTRCSRFSSAFQTC